MQSFNRPLQTRYQNLAKALKLFRVQTYVRSTVTGFLLVLVSYAFST